MTGLIEDGDYAAFRKADRGVNGKVVAAIVNNVAMLKLYNEIGKKAFLMSTGDGYPAIPVDRHVRIQGIYVDHFPSPKLAGLRVRHVEPPIQ